MNDENMKEGLHMKWISRTNRYQLESLESRRLLATYAVDLGILPGGTSSAATDINASGQVVGTVTMDDGNDRAFIWQQGVMTDLGSLGGGLSRAYALNDVGQVVGMTSSSAGYRAFLVTPEDTDSNGAPDRWFRDSNSDGKNDLMRDLGTIGGNYNYAWANDVNNLGQVVGIISNGPTFRAFRWENGVMTNMGAFGGHSSYAYAINDAGQITGASTTGPFLWKAGVVTLGVGGTDINAAGQLVSGSQSWTPTIPNGSTGTFTTLGQLPPVWDYPEVWTELSAQSINAVGHVVGYQTDNFSGETSTGLAYRGVRWIDGIPELLPLEFASAINDSGQIVGSRDGRAYLLANENFPMPLLAISGVTVTEGHSGTTNAVLTVSLSKASSQTITVQYATADGAATAGDDYLAKAGTLTFTPGQTSKTISVQVLGDRIADYSNYQTFSEAFTVALSNPSNALVSGTPANGVILDDEPRIAGARTTVLEGNVGSKTAMVTVSLSSAYDQPVTFSYETQDGTTTEGSDYVATSGTVTFAPGQTTKQLPVSILGDRVAEVNEVFGGDTKFFYVFLTNPSANASVISHGGVNIIDDEPRVTVNPYSVVVTEPASGTIDALLTVSLSAAYDQDVIVGYMTYSDNYLAAVAGSDYVATVANVTIPAGQTSRTITVPIIGDGVAEEIDEYFSVYLTTVSANAVIADYGYEGSVRIRDYDGTVKTWIGLASGGNWSTAANWSPSGVPSASDVVTISGKSVNLSTSTIVGALNLTGGATLTLAANGDRVLRTSSLSISVGSVLDLADNDLLIDYTGGSPYADVKGYVLSGRDTGIGIVSSPGDGDVVLAVVDSAQYGATHWNDIPIDDTTIIGKYTFYGDANLDGMVTSDDYVAVDVGIGTNPGTSQWFHGDFDFDGNVTSDDYVAIDVNLGSGVGDPLAVGEPSDIVTAVEVEAARGKSGMKKPRAALELRKK